jgi:hypothetical protein
MSLGPRIDGCTHEWTNCGAAICLHCGVLSGDLRQPSESVMYLLLRCVESLAGYRREMNDNQPCDAEKAARTYLGLTLGE